MTDSTRGDRRTPSSTYRLQLTPEFGFDAARQLVPYLAELGVSHLYLSPVLQARSGSTHGYDVADPTTVSRDLGGENGLVALAEAAHAAGLGVVIDIVPNHLGIGPENPDWQYLLAEGASGEGGRVFDVDWNPALPGGEGKVILPVLGDQYGAVLANGELRLVEEPDEHGRRFRIRYHDHSFPLSPESQEALERVGRIDTLTGEPGQLESWQRLHGLLERQHYRLVFWRIGDRVINYRRFFAVSELAGVRQEDEHVFERTHAKIIDLVEQGIVDGLRVDHPDGLRDPRRYLDRLAERTDGVWTVVEKITHPGEPLEPWATAGTTGYEFCNDVVGLFVDPSAREEFDALAARLGADPAGYDEQVAEAKREVLRNDLSSELARLSTRMWALAQSHVQARDVEDRHCLAALTDVLVGMEVYRSYVDPETGEATDRDRVVVRTAVDKARRAAHVPAVVLDLLESLLAGARGTDPAHLDFIARFQQLSGALMAKGVEDTVFYRYLRMVALNEVGGDPSHFGLSVEQFHQRQQERADHHPTAMLTTATHDTKRGEDVRLRIAALTEMPSRWADVATALVTNAEIDGPTALLLLQTMVGTWPLTDSGEQTPPWRERLVAYAQKATREAGLHTNWYDPSPAYEAALAAFIDAVLGSDHTRKELGALAETAAEIGMVSSLAQVVLRTLSPGVPDTYQGNELWDDSLVDPDNRRPVDWQQRHALVSATGSTGLDELWAGRRDGRVKLATLRACLALRAEYPEAFGANSGYRPLSVRGTFADSVVAFVRDAADRNSVVVIVPRLVGRVMGTDFAPPLGDRWGDTSVELPEGDWVNVFGGGTSASVADLFAGVPVAVLKTAS